MYIVHTIHQGKLAQATGSARHLRRTTHTPFPLPSPPRYKMQPIIPTHRPATVRPPASPILPAGATKVGNLRFLSPPSPPKPLTNLSSKPTARASIGTPERPPWHPCKCVPCLTPPPQIFQHTSVVKEISKAATAIALAPSYASHLTRSCRLHGQAATKGHAQIRTRDYQSDTRTVRPLPETYYIFSCASTYSHTGFVSEGRHTHICQYVMVSTAVVVACTCNVSPGTRACVRVYGRDLTIKQTV